MENEKEFPKVGDKLYLSQETGDSWVDMVKRPYDVIQVNPNSVLIQAAKCVFDGPQYYDSLPTKMLKDESGEIVELHWAPKKKRWQYDKYKTGYPEIAHFGEYAYQPYLN